MIETLIEIATGAMVGAIVAGAVSYLRVKKYQQAAKTAQVLALDVSTHKVLERVVDLTPCDRALVLALHNGGGRLMAGAPKYASAIHEAHSDEVGAALDDFQRFRIDMDYTMLIEQVKARGIVFLTTAAMNESMLRRRYALDGIQAAIVVSIAETPNRYYYASFSTCGNPDDLMSVANYARIESAVNELRNLYVAAKRGGYLA